MFILSGILKPLFFLLTKIKNSSYCKHFLKDVIIMVTFKQLKTDWSISNWSIERLMKSSSLTREEAIKRIARSNHL